MDSKIPQTLKIRRVRGENLRPLTLNLWGNADELNCLPISASVIPEFMHEAMIEPSSTVGAHVEQASQDNGLFNRAVGGNSIAFCPPLIISTDQIDEMIDKFGQALQKTHKYAQTEGLLTSWGILQDDEIMYIDVLKTDVDEKLVHSAD